MGGMDHYRCCRECGMLAWTDCSPHKVRGIHRYCIYLCQDTVVNTHNLLGSSVAPGEAAMRASNGVLGS